MIDLPRTYPGRPIVGVGGIVLVDGCVVLVRRGHAPLAGEWSLPGGALELGETLQEGIAREIREETGLVVDVGPLVGVFDRILLDDGGQVQYHYVLVDYVCQARGGTLCCASDATEAAIADPQALEAYQLARETQDVIARALTLTKGSGLSERIESKDKP